MKNLLILIFSLFSLVSYSQSFGWEVVSFNQGLNNIGGAVAIERSNPSKALGQAQNNDTQSPLINFVSLGFGGDIILRLQYPIVITPNTSMSIYETTFEYSNCSAYGETADIYVSKNNIDYFYLDQTCLNTNTIFDLYNIGLDSILYVKIKDVSDVSKFSNYSFLSDGYDLDGIIINENGPLPIILKRFGVDYSNNILRINFITSSESNTYKFVIQSSIDASNFQDIIEFVAAGYSSFDRVYQSQMDFYPIGDITYFRLVEFDINGDIFYFDIIFVKTDIKKNSDEFYYDIMGRRVSYNYNSIIILKSKF